MANSRCEIRDVDDEEEEDDDDDEEEKKERQLRNAKRSYTCAKHVSGWREECATRHNTLQTCGCTAISCW